MDFYIFLVYLLAYLGLFVFSFYLIGLIKYSKGKKVEPAEDKTVTIIIPAYNEEKSIERTIESALKLDYPKDKLEIIVVDDGSKDDTYKLAKKFLSNKNPKISVFTKTNGGKATALNFGIEKAKGEIVISMDADTFVSPDALKIMIGYFKDEYVAAVTPSMGVYNTKGFLQRIQEIEYYTGVFLRKSFSIVDAIHIAPGAFSAYRKEFFEKHGGYDVGNITEDLELSLRIQRYNYKIENASKAVVYTTVPDNFKQLMFQRRRWYVGLLKNLKNYRDLFGLKYGALGTVVLPVALISIFIGVGLTIYTLINSLIRIKNYLIDFNSVNFIFHNAIDFNFFIFQNIFYDLFSNQIFILTLGFIFVLLFYLYFSRRHMKYQNSFYFSFSIFLIFYSILYAFWWIISLIYIIGNREVKWRHDETKRN